MTDRTSGVNRLRKTLFGARWAGVYLATAAALIALAGSEVSSPSAEEHARKVEFRAAAELRPLADAAAAVAGSVTRERARLEAERKSKLDAAVVATRSWLRVSSTKGRLADRLASSAGDLVPLVPAGIAVAVIGSAGEPLFECGGRVDLDSPETRVESVMAEQMLGLTLAAAWTEPLPDGALAAQAALSSALSGAAPAGTGLYFVGPEGELAAKVATRPVRAAPLAPTFATRPSYDGAPPYLSSGDLETGKLITVRRVCQAFGSAEVESVMGWTVVAERFVSPEELAEGAPAGFGMIALTALGLVAAAAFAHAVRAGVIGSRRRMEDVDAERGRGRPHLHSAPAARPVITALASGVGAMQADAHAEAEPVPTGRSILRLREALGTPAEGPDIAACARSPILRALAKNVRSPRPVALPREVTQWGARTARGAPPTAFQLRKSA